MTSIDVARDVAQEVVGQSSDEILDAMRRKFSTATTAELESAFLSALEKIEVLEERCHEDLKAVIALISNNASGAEIDAAIQRAKLHAQSSCRDNAPTADR